MTTESRLPKTPVRVQSIVRHTFIILVTLALLEGTVSFLLLCYEFLTTYPVAERLHTQYDADLGWVSKPNVHIPDMYGEGISLRTNSQGFRADADFGAAVPPGKSRIVCSGDSFTLGYGVGNNQAWCDLLALRDPRLETLNMGQGGYGLDQVYLWYKRDGLRFEHQIHLLAVISEDLDRMQSDTLLGYAKPVVDVQDGTLVVRNVPVPKRGYMLSRLHHVSRHARTLRTADLMGRALTTFGVTRPTKVEPVRNDKHERTRQVAEKILEDLDRLNSAKSSRLVVVYLPLLKELRSDHHRQWLNVLQAKSRALQIPFVNVLDVFRSLTYAQALDMFIPEGQIPYLGAAGHLSHRGNRFVAGIIYDALTADPNLSQTVSRMTAQ